MLAVALLSLAAVAVAAADLKAFEDNMAWLTNATQYILVGCQTPNDNGTVFASMVSCIIINPLLISSRLASSRLTHQIRTARSGREILPTCSWRRTILLI